MSDVALVYRRQDWEAIFDAIIAGTASRNDPWHQARLVEKVSDGGHYRTQIERGRTPEAPVGLAVMGVHNANVVRKAADILGIQEVGHEHYASYRAELAAESPLTASERAALYGPDPALGHLVRSTLALEKRLRDLEHELKVARRNAFDDVQRGAAGGRDRSTLCNNLLDRLVVTP